MFDSSSLYSDILIFALVLKFVFYCFGFYLIAKLIFAIIDWLKRH